MKMKDFHFFIYDEVQITSNIFSFKCSQTPVREFWQIFLLISAMHAAVKKLVFLPHLSIIDTRQTIENLTTKFKTLATSL